jgi:hypothetical protein
MLVMGEGRNPGTTQLQALGKQHGIKSAQEILAKVKAAVANWLRHAEQADVSRRSTQEIAGKIKLQRLSTSSNPGCKPIESSLSLTISV